MSLTNQCRSLIINTVTKEESRREAKTEQDITLTELEFNVVEICSNTYRRHSKAEYEDKRRVPANHSI